MPSSEILRAVQEQRCPDCNSNLQLADDSIYDCMTCGFHLDATPPHGEDDDATIGPIG